MIVLIYVLSILYILVYFIHKFLKVWLSNSIELNRRINNRIIYKTIFFTVINFLLFISKKTVESHRDRILQKIKARNMIGIAMYAIKHNIIVWVLRIRYFLIFYGQICRVTFLYI